jgi:uncharacterized membrane protein HdeD (DUF308 family)
MTNAMQAGGRAHQLGAHWGWIVALGILYVVVGMIALGNVVEATVASVYWVGVMMIVAGVGETINAFRMQSWGKFFLWAILGVLYILGGIFCWQNPLLAAGTLTLLLGVSLVVGGIVRIYLATQMKTGSAWGWVALSGLITAVFGLVILGHWPVSSLFILGIMLGVDLVFAGVSWITMGFALRG